MARVFVVDDHPLTRIALFHLVESRGVAERSGEAALDRDAVPSVVEYDPDLVILGLSLNISTGLDFLKDLSARLPHTPCLVLGIRQRPLVVQRILKAGACGYLTKKAPAQEVLSAIDRALTGDTYIEEGLRGPLLDRLTAPNTSSVTDLSDREFQVFTLVGQGNSPAEIAEELALSVKTVESYVDRLRKKLGLQSSRELSYEAVSWLLGRQN
jgi:DNA-binding NarL/FixJ family response regulator